MYHLLSIVFLILQISLSLAKFQCKLLNNSNSDILKSLTSKTHYEKWLVPVPENGGPLIVKIKMYIFYLNAKETSKLDITMQLMLELSWEDPRLKYHHLSSNIKSISGGKAYLDNIWLPHIIFTNVKDSQKMGTVRKDDFVNILPNGSILLTTRIMTSMDCLLHLGNFPFDHQHCHLNLGSLMVNASRLKLVWDEETPLIIDGLAGLVEFDILELINKTSMKRNSEPTNVQQFSSLTIEMMLERNYGYYIVNYYLPSELLVIVSWFSFWIDPSVVPARVSLGVSTMLTFIQLDMTGSGSPRTSEFMANDVWCITCTAFIFLSLAEFAFVNSIERKKGVEKVRLKKLSSKHILRGGVDTAAGRAKLRRSSSCPSSPEIRRHFARNPNAFKTVKELKEVSISLGNLLNVSTVGVPTATQKHGSSVFTMTPQEIAIWIDSKSRIVFPLSFLIFNLIYWVPLFIL